MSEKAFQSLVKSHAVALGWLAYHTHNSRRSDPGFPDLVLVRGGVLIFAELKTEKGKTSESQEVWINAVRENNTPVYVWRPRNWAEIKEVLA